MSKPKIIADETLLRSEMDVHLAMGDFEDAIRAAESVAETDVLRERLTDLWKRVTAQIDFALLRGHRISAEKG